MPTGVYSRQPLSEATKIKLRQKMLQKWSDGTYQKLCGTMISEATKQKISGAIKQCWKDPNYRNLKVNQSISQWSLTNKLKSSKLLSERWRNPEYREKVIATIRRFTSRQSYRDNMRLIAQTHIKQSRENSRKIWKDPVLRQNMLAKIRFNAHNSSFIEKCRRSSKNRWDTDPIFRQKCLEHLQEARNSPQRLENLYRVMASPEFRSKVCEGVSKAMRNPMTREKLSQSSKKSWQNSEYRAKMAGLRSRQPKVSTQQSVLHSLLDDLQVKYVSEYPIGFYTFDCCINLQPNIKLSRPLLIEVQGDYWHGLEKNVRNDRSKATYLRTYFPEYDLKYLWEHEFDNKDRIRELLRYWLGLSQTNLKQFNLRDIQQKQIDFKEAELFISKYHYAGRIGRSGINLGYYLNDKLIATIIYSSPIRQEVALKQGYVYKEVLELSRLAIHPEYQVKNLASYIIARSIDFIKKQFLDIKLLISFADSTHNHLGTIYKASNWILDGEVAPDYWYVDDRGYVCHKKTLWNKAKKFGMTEGQYCSRYNYSKIWGEKKYRFLYNIMVCI